jgi:hypothetical protein
MARKGAHGVCMAGGISTGDRGSFLLPDGTKSKRVVDWEGACSGPGGRSGRISCWSSMMRELAYGACLPRIPPSSSLAFDHARPSGTPFPFACPLSFIIPVRWDIPSCLSYSPVWMVDCGTCCHDGLARWPSIGRFFVRRIPSVLTYGVSSAFMCGFLPRHGRGNGWSSQAGRSQRFVGGGWVALAIFNYVLRTEEVCCDLFVFPEVAIDPRPATSPHAPLLRESASWTLGAVSSVPRNG